MQISLIVPTLQAELVLPHLLDKLAAQSFPPNEVIVVDSSSSDNTVHIALERGCQVQVIPRTAFRHGRSRNLGASLANGDILVFITQDIIPASVDFLVELIQPVVSGEAIAAYGRQIPGQTANPIEAFARQYNYPQKSEIRSFEDVPVLGVRTFFFSDSASCIHKQAFWQVGGFSEEVIVNEDMELCTRLLKAGFSVAYQSEACVVHSHEYSLKQLFRRYFKIGVFFSGADDALRNTHDREGGRFVLETIRYLATHHYLRWIPRFALESSLKLIAFRMGKAHKRLPFSLKQRLSGEPSFWQTETIGKAQLKA